MQRRSAAPSPTTEAGFSLPFCSPHGTAWGQFCRSLAEQEKKERKSSRKEAGREERDSFEGKWEEKKDRDRHRLKELLINTVLPQAGTAQNE